MKFQLNKMKASRIFGLFLLVLLFTITACQNENQPHAKSKQKSNNGPVFKKEGDIWLVKAATGDTIIHLDAEYAISPTDQNYGMMYRKSMSENMSMLFFRDVLEMQSFWMKNTYVSLDIIYLDENQRIVNIQKNAEPLNTKSLPSTGPALYVLEIKGGLSDKIGLQAGDVMYFRDL